LKEQDFETLWKVVIEFVLLMVEEYLKEKRRNRDYKSF
jgi:hypothetical protein